MKRTLIIFTFMLLAVVLPMATILASDISGALYKGTVRVTNTSYTASDVSVPFVLNTQALLDGYYIYSDFSNVAIQDDNEVDVPFMPAVGEGSDWFLFVDQISQNISLNYYIYAGGDDMGSTIYYFPGANGMATGFSATLGFGNYTFEIEQKGYINTSAGEDKYLFYEPYGGPPWGYTIRSYISGEEEITAELDFGAGSDPYSVSYTTQTNYHYLYGSHYLAQTFPAEYDFYTDEVTLYGKRTGTAYGINVYLYAVDGDGKPTGSWLAKAKVNTSTWGTGSPAAHDIPFNSGYLMPADNYAIVMTYGGPDISNRLNIHYDFAAGYPDGQAWHSDDFGDTWVSDEDEDYYFVISGYPPEIATVTATGVSSGEHTIKLVRDSSDFSINIDGDEKDSEAVSGSMKGDGSDYVSFENDAMPCVEYQKITINGTLRQHIIWENSTTFTDLSGNGNDATPTFRTTSSDPDVSATLLSFGAIEESEMSGIDAGEAPEVFTEVPEVPSMHEELNVSSLPGADLMNELLDGAGIPRSLFWFPVIFGLAIAAGMITFYFAKDALIMSAVSGAVLIFFAAMGAVPLWTLIPYIAVIFAVLAARKTVSL